MAKWKKMSGATVRNTEIKPVMVLTKFECKETEICTRVKEGDIYTRRRTRCSSTCLAKVDRSPIERLRRNGKLASEACTRQVGKQMTRQADKDIATTEQASIVHILGQHLTLILVSISLIILAYSVTATEGVDCFKCSSRNGSNPACEDPFHNLNTTRVTSPILPDPQPNVIYHAPCYAGRKGRDGLFLASTCIKLTGTFDATGEKLVVRHCALDSGTLTQDTELARMSHCGKFQFDGDSLQGCVVACPEDACNSAPPNALLSQQTYIILVATLTLSLLRFIT